MAQTYDRGAQDIGNIVALEHVNVRIPSQQLATAFYVVGLGFTRDPYLMVGLENMWINVGQQQFHMPTGKPQKFPGWIGIVVPDLDALVTRLTSVKERLARTEVEFCLERDTVLRTRPQGNRLRCPPPGP